MKIPLFSKPYTLKVCFFFIILIILIQPSRAQAGFFSDLITKVFGSEVQTETIVIPPSNEVIHNSQNVPLLESSINPDLKSMDKVESEPVAIKNDTLLSSDGSLGVDTELEKYSSSTKIVTYTVKKGDTIESISKDLKVSKESIISSNADLKKSDLIKIGQKLVIIGLKDDPSLQTDKKVATKETTPKNTETPAKVEVKEPEPKANTEVSVPAETPKIETPVVNTPPVVVQTPTAPEQNQSALSGQPDGTIDGGYIWPFPAGVGRVSQGRHADNAYDFSAPKGTPIYAVQSGTVFITHPSGYNGGFGLYVVINFDDGRQAIFGHMSKVLVQEGQVVKQGEVIGLVGSTGKSTGPHVHIGFHGSLSNPYLGLKKNSTSLDDHD